MGRFEPSLDLTGFIPADYNPRVIDEDATARLRESIRTLGLIRPVIVTEARRILAGHQRTRAMAAESMTHCPAFVLPAMNSVDEIRFNQLHNASDVEFGEQTLSLAPMPGATGFVDVPFAAFRGSPLGRMASKRNEILRLMTRFGQFAAIVVSQSGEILVGVQYAACCRIAGHGVKAYVVPDDKAAAVRHYFGQEYGRFSYDHLPKTTWAQSLAQMMRLRNEESGKGKSRTYEFAVLPNISKSMRILDFGAGQKDYVKKLQRAGYDIHGLEFYYRQGDRIDVAQVNRDIDTLCRDLERRGRFDVVVCDSVLNSVDSVEAERDVLNSINALCRMDGLVIFSGRAREFVDEQENRDIRRLSGKVRRVEFLDGDGLTAMFSRGVWRYQKYHTYDEVRRIAESHFGRHLRIKCGSPVDVTNFTYGGWSVVVKKEIEIARESAIQSLTNEFTLPLPGGRKYQRESDILRAFTEALKHEDHRDHKDKQI